MAAGEGGDRRTRRVHSAMAFRRSDSKLIDLMMSSDNQQMGGLYEEDGGGLAWQARSLGQSRAVSSTPPSRRKDRRDDYEGGSIANRRRYPFPAFEALQGSILMAKDTLLQHQAQEIGDLRKSSSKSLARAWAKIKEQEDVIQKLRNKISLIEAESNLLRQKLDMRKQKQQELSSWMKMNVRISGGADFDGPYTSKSHKLFKTKNCQDIPIWQHLYFRFRECQKVPNAGPDEARVSPMWILFERVLSRQMESDDFILAMNMLYSQFQQSARNSSLVELHNQISCLNKVMTCMSAMLEIPGSIMDLPLLTSRMLEIAMELCAARSGRILFQQEGDHNLIVMAALSRTKQNEYIDAGHNNRAVPMDGIVGKVVRQERTLNYKMGNDLAADFNKATDIIAGHDTTPFVCSPILDATGSVLGCLQLFDHLTEKKAQDGDRVLNFFNNEQQVSQRPNRENPFLMDRAYRYSARNLQESAERSSSSAERFRSPGGPNSSCRGS
eukprot:766681-Hanusia_phi.AAC.4